MKLAEPFPTSRRANRRKIARFLLGLLLAISIGSYADPAPGATVPALHQCISLFRSKKFFQAARCFKTLEASLARSKSSSLEKKAMRGRALRSAAKALYQAAQQARQIERAAYLRQQAVRLLDRYIKQRLYQVAYQKQQAELLKYRWQQQIGLALLTVLTGSPRAKILVEGYRFRAEVRGSFARNVRPGPYTVTVRYPGHSRPTVRRFHITPHKPHTLVFSPPKPASRRRAATPKPPIRPAPRPPLRRIPKPQPPPKAKRSSLPWILLGTGAAATIGGAIVLGVAQATAGERDRFFSQKTSSSSKPTLEDSRKLIEMNQQIGTLFPAGWIILGAGAATAATGAILLIAGSSNAKRRTKTASP